MGAAAIKTIEKIREYFRFTRNGLRILIIFSLIFLSLLAFRGYEEWRWKHRPTPPNVLAFEKKYLEAIRDGKVRGVTGTGKQIARGIGIDLNRATRDELIQLPGIGPKMAERILSYRKKHGLFRTKKELLKIRGIGAKKFKKIEPYLK